MTTASSLEGFAPTVLVSNIRPEEKELYERMWAREEYRAISPGEEVARVFLQQAKPRKGASVLDLGCGTGRGGLNLAVFGGLDVTLVDFARNCLDADILPMLETQAHALRFVQADLSKHLPVSAEYGFCADVLEHIPPEQVDAVLNNCLRAAAHCFFHISCVDDSCGVLVGHKLHLSVHDYAWWLNKFNERQCIIHWSQDSGSSCLFYVTGWIDGKVILDEGEVNEGQEQIRANVKHNIAQGWNQVVPHETNDVDLMLIGGGPSLPEHLDDIRRLREDGVKLIALNGAYNWCLDNGLTPSALVIVDARPFNERFTRQVIDGCKYFIASQCDPGVFEGLPQERTYIWHTASEHIKDVLAEQYEKWWSVPAATTVLCTSIPLLRMLGFRRFHLFGCDSCVTETAHHAYPQPENDSPVVVNAKFNVGDRIFRCHPWMIAQAQQMIELVKFMGEEIELEVHGDGLLAYLFETGAQLADLEPSALV